MRVCIVQPTLNAISETFLRAHAERLPNVVGVIDSMPGVPAFHGTPILSRRFAFRAARKVGRIVRGLGWDAEVTKAYAAGFASLKCDIVLAQYGPTGVAVMEACHQMGIPLVTHFHGFDASQHDVIKDLIDRYRVMFELASGVVAVSVPMRKKLIDLGAPQDRTYVNHYGVDIQKFIPSSIEVATAMFLAVGRLVEKKAPQTTILAFSRVQKEIPGARLVIVGDGPLRSECEGLIKALKLEECVELRGAHPNEEIVRLMQRATAFVQHSVEATNGDCEGLPNSILEASASGLPIIATRHAGIPEAVIDGQTGYLVDEGDVEGMANRMSVVARDPRAAREMGKAGREYVVTHFEIKKSIDSLLTVLRSSLNYHRSKMQGHTRS